MQTNFTHLHVHTQYSLLDGAIRLPDLFARCKQYGMDSVAITDHGTMFGVIDFYQSAKKEGIKPIIGCECYVAPRTLQDKTPIDSKGATHLVLLAKDMQGYLNLCKLATIAQMEGFYYKPRIDREVLEKHCQGLIGLSGCLKGEVSQLILADKQIEAEAAAAYYEQLFGKGNYYLEVQQNGIKEQVLVNQGLFEINQKLDIPLVATNDCHYLNQEDAKAHEVLLCIQTGKTMQDHDRFVFETDQLFFKSPEQMEKEFKAFPGAYENTRRIAEQCNVDFEFGKYYFPLYDAKTEKTPDQIFEEQVRQGYAERIQQLIAKHPDLDRGVYDERLEYELKTIIDMGFPGYFLIVADFIRYAKQAGIPVGPGRGSAAGSLVSYAMQITDLDPIEHGLIFERFLNPARISMPDIDVDFCIKGREKVLQYVAERYGHDYVAQIITYGKMKARMVIRDVGRALGFEVSEINTIAKLVPDELKMTVAKALDQEPRLAELVKSNPQVKELIDVSLALEGLPRHASTHAAGVVIGDRPLVEHLPLYRGKKGEVVTQLDMKKVEEIGLVKFDFLGLRNLTVIDSALEMIRQQGIEPPDLSNLPLDDPKTFDLLQAGDSTGVFQLESTGIKSLMVKVHPESFAELTALVALYRPGPLDSGMVDDFVERKHGRKAVEYMDPRLEPILKETYGVMVYQEQVMQVAGVLAGYSMADADSLRKAIGKKIAKLMAEHREKFVKGCVANNVPERKAVELFDLIEKFGGYGFNKSHSAAYALIAYHTAYLKAHYPVSFMAALLTSEMGAIDGVVKFINECRTHKVDVLPPDINESNAEFTVVDGKIRFGLAAIKNVGEGAIELIIKEKQENGQYKSLLDFCTRVDLKKVNKRVLESLIRCGAFDSTGELRSRLIGMLEDALKYGQCIQKEQSNTQMCLFGSPDGEDDFGLEKPYVPQLPEWEADAKLAFEKEALGFYVSGHPLDQFRTILEKHASATTEELFEVDDEAMVYVGGMIKGAKTILTKKNDRMAFATVEDLHGAVEVVVFPSVFNACSELIVDDQPVLVYGKVQHEEGSVKILADKIIPLGRADEWWAIEAHFIVDSEKTDEEALVRLYEIIKKHPGQCPGFIHIQLPENIDTVIGLSDGFGVSPNTVMAAEINGLFGYNVVRIERKAVAVV